MDSCGKRNRQPGRQNSVKELCSSSKRATRIGLSDVTNIVQDSKKRPLKKIGISSYVVSVPSHGRLSSVENDSSTFPLYPACSGGSEGMQRCNRLSGFHGRLLPGRYTLHQTRLTRHSINSRPFDVANQIPSHVQVEELATMMCVSNYEDPDVPTTSGATIHEKNDIQFLECETNAEDSDVPLYTDDDAEMDEVVDDEVLPGIEDSDYLNIGPPTYACQKCGAIMWYEERVIKHTRPAIPKFSLCCLRGRVVLPAYSRLPQYMHDLYHKRDRASKFFFDNIRLFNSMFAFTYMGGRVDNSMNYGRAPPMFVMNGENYHQIGSLLSLPSNQPKFAQLYIYDTDNEIANRMVVVRTIRDRILQQPGHSNIRLRILGKRGRDGRRYNLPSASEVATLIVGDFDTFDFERDIVVESQSGLLQRVSVFEPAYLPLQYPLLFPREEYGFWKDIPFNEEHDPDSSKREFISRKSGLFIESSRDVLMNQLFFL